MIANLEILSDSVSWIFDKKEIIIFAADVFFAAENKELNLVTIYTGKNFIEKKVLFYNFDGSLGLCYDLESSTIDWGVGGNSRHLCVKYMKQVGFFPQKERIFIVTGYNEQELHGYTLDGRRLFVANSPSGFEMKYFTIVNDRVTVVCDGNKENEDKYGRFRYNFYIDINNGKLTKGNIAY